MPKFHVRDTFEMATGRKLYVMVGHVVEGLIRAGMFVNVPCNAALNMTARIHSIEFARRFSGEEVGLCFEFEPEVLELWRNLSIANETLEISDGPCEAMT
ncbi:MAG: hypothetical protein KDK99_09615 [Verrucomicrobiales bacterium]|nr:hypothetical protein [Verrucomicrobiales bacterium]